METLLIVILLAAAVAFASVRIIKNRKHGKKCCGDCAACLSAGGCKYAAQESGGQETQTEQQ